MSVFEQVPQYSLVQLDDGLEEKVQLVIKIPGVSSVSEFNVTLEPHRFELHAPGRYFLELSLDVTVDQIAEELKFVKKRSEVKAILSVVGGRPESSRGVSRGRASLESSKIPSTAAGLHDSFLADAAKLMSNKPRRVRSAGKAKSFRPVSISKEREPVVRDELGTDAEMEDDAEEFVNESSLASSATQAELDFSYSQNHWHVGRLTRTIGSDGQTPAGGEGVTAPSSDGIFEAMSTSHPERVSRPRVDEELEAEIQVRKLHNENGVRADSAEASSETGKGGRSTVQEAALPRQDLDKDHEERKSQPKANTAKTLPKRPSKRPDLDIEAEPVSPSARPDTPKASEGHKRFGKLGSGKQRKEKQAPPHSAPSAFETSRPNNDQSQQEDDGETEEATSSQPQFGSELWFEEWKEKRKHYGAARLAIAAALIVLAILALDLLRISFAIVLRLALAAPHMIPNLMLKLRWTRLHRKTLRTMQRSREMRWALAISAFILTSTSVWYGVKIVWGLLGLTCSLLNFTAKSSLSSSLWALRSFIWKPNFWRSISFSLFLRYAFLLFGANIYTRGANCFWGWPLMAWASGAGFLGLLTSAFSLASSLLNISHVSLVISFWAASLPEQLLGWQPNVWLRLASFVWTAGYLFFFGSLAPLPREGAYAVAAAREVPEGAEGEVARVLQAVDHYEVLQVPVSADAETLRKAKRSKALGTHPDKLGQAAGANEAFGRVTEAYEILSDDKKRHQYNAELKQRAIFEQMQSEHGFEDSPADNFAGPSGVSFFCPTCNRDHAGRFVNRSADKARWCGECKEYHPARSGDGWHESSFGVFGSKIKMFVCIDDKVMDVTEWANCVLKSSVSQMPVNAHSPQYSFGASSESQSSAPNKKKKGKARKRR